MLLIPSVMSLEKTLLTSMVTNTKANNLSMEIKKQHDISCCNKEHFDEGVCKYKGKCPYQNYVYFDDSSNLCDLYTTSSRPSKIKKELDNLVDYSSNY